MMKINDKRIEFNSSPYIIAEAGVNHNGSLKMAKKMVDQAIKSNANCIKFQTFNPKKLASKSAPKADYQKISNSNSESQLSMLESLTLRKSEFRELKKYCDNSSIEFLSTPFDHDSLEFLIDLDVSAIKIGSGDLTNLWLLEQVSETGISTILSTGMSNLTEIEIAVNIFDKDNLALLHCVSSYPTPHNQVNLNVMKTLRDAFKVPIGFSDHTLGIEIPIAATALGAAIIEKHFTLDKNLPGPDHKSSLEPAELTEMINGIKKVYQSLGDGIKKPQNCELETKKVARKSLVYSKSLKKGEIISRNKLEAKRPGTGIEVKDFVFINNRRLKKDVKEDDLVRLDDFE